ncbi:unnamed protein product, partial [Mesorhabditis spiculigera]
MSDVIHALPALAPLAIERARKARGTCHNRFCPDLAAPIFRVVDQSASDFRAVEFPYSAPDARLAQDYDYIFGAPVTFGAQRAALEFDNSAMRAPIIQTEETLEEYLRESPIQLMSERDYDSTASAQVRRVLELGVKGRTSTAEEIAEMLSISVPHLRRLLRRDGTSLNQLREEVLRDVAIAGLRRGESVERVPSGLQTMDRRHSEFVPLADAELVSFGIGHRDPHARPLRSPVQDRRPHRLEVRCDILALVAHSYVEMEPVLHRLRFRNQLEQNAGTFGMLRIADGRTFAPDENSLEGRGVRFLGVTSSDEAPDEVFVAGLRCPPECCGPPLRLFVRVCRIYCDLEIRIPCSDVNADHRHLVKVQPSRASVDTLDGLHGDQRCHPRDSRKPAELGDHEVLVRREIFHRDPNEVVGNSEQPPTFDHFVEGGDLDSKSSMVAWSLTPISALRRRPRLPSNSRREPRRGGTLSNCRCRSDSACSHSGIALGVLVVQQGLNPRWAVAFTSLIYAGSLEFLAVGMVAAMTPLPYVALTALLVNFRHVFYALSFPLEKIRNPFARFYSMFALTDEGLCDVGNCRSQGTHRTRHRLLPAVPPRLLDRWRDPGRDGRTVDSDSIVGLDFALTALFVVLSIEAIRAQNGFAVPVAAVTCALVARLAAPDHMLPIAMGAFVLFLIGRFVYDSRRRRSMPDTSYIFAAVAVMAVVTFALRAIPFAALMPLRSSALVGYLGIYMPAGVMLILVMYSLKGVSITAPSHGLPN